MNKIRLDVDALEVTSFDAAGVPSGRGTVQGRAALTNEPRCTRNCTQYLICVTDADTCETGPQAYC